jgi:peptide/nickel transport system substrate-binding protein
MMYNNLFIIDDYRNGELRGDLVERWSFDASGTKLTLNLHRGVKWHDGTPFTSADVVYTLGLAQFPPAPWTASGFTRGLTPMKSVKAVDASTVEIELTQASNAFMTALTHWNLVMLPSHLTDLDALSKNPVGTGPFTIKGFERDISEDWVKNPEYWDKDEQGRQLPYLDGQKWFAFSDQTLYVSALRTGRIKFGEINSSGAIEASVETLRSSIPGIVIDFFAGGPRFLRWKNVLPFNDRRVRDAIDLFVDRKTTTDLGWGGAAHGGGIYYPTPLTPAQWNGKWSLAPEEIQNRPGFRLVDSTGKVVTTLEEYYAKRAELRKDPRDIQRARELLQQAGIKRGELGFEVVPSFAGDAVRGAPIIAAQMKDLFGATWTVNTSPTVGTDTVQGRWAVNMFVYGWGLDDPSGQVLNWLTQGVSTVYPVLQGFGADDPDIQKIERLFAEQDRTLDPTKRRELTLEMERTILDWRGSVIITGGSATGAYWPDIKNPPDAQHNQPNSYRLDRVWLAR